MALVRINVHEDPVVGVGRAAMFAKRPQITFVPQHIGAVFGLGDHQDPVEPGVEQEAGALVTAVFVVYAHHIIGLRPRTVGIDADHRHIADHRQLFVVPPGECDGNQARHVPGFHRLVDGVPVVFYQQHGVVAHLSYLFFQRADDRAVECIVDQ